MRRRDAHRQPSLLAMHFDDAAWNAIELTRDQHTRRCRNLLAQSHGELVDALPAFDSDRGTRRAHHANLDRWSVHSPLQRPSMLTTPSITSRSRSAWPLCRVSSSMQGSHRCGSYLRRLAHLPSNGCTTQGPDRTDGPS